MVALLATHAIGTKTLLILIGLLSLFSAGAARAGETATDGHSSSVEKYQRTPNATARGRVVEGMRSSWTGSEIWTGGATLDADHRKAEHSDEGLALAVRRRQDGAFERLIATFEKPLFNYAHKLLQDTPDAQEVVQDTFLRSYRALTQQYSDDRCRDLALRPWLYRIARNLSHNKRRGKRHSVEEPLEDLEARAHLPSGDDIAIICRVEQKQELERLNRAIARLPRESRDLVFLRFIEEMSYSEISKTTGFGEASLRGKVFRSLKLLRQTLAEEETTHAV